jgi:hypothetical protein
MSEIHKSSLAAWADLQKRAGLELNGRDDGFEQALKNRLAPSAASLEEALRSATTDDLVHAFFDVIQPFVAMFRAILDFFERAGAAEGREQWNIEVDKADVRLDHFRRFLKKWNSVPCQIEVPAVDFRGAWSLFDATREMGEMSDVNAGYRSGVADIDNWLRAYRDGPGYYEEWPASLAPSSLGEGYSDAAALALAGLETIRQRFASRKELNEHRRLWRGIDDSDALDIRTIARNETDYWLGTLTARLAHSKTLQGAERKQLGERLKAAFARFPRRKFGASIKIADLQSYLSLPVWQKRHELYAVWIATEIVNALPDHICEIHHEEGKIVFAFRETVVATVKSAWPPVRIISERRVPLTAPVGKGRKANVQPDYGLWRNEAGVESCGLVVEVKHYKRSATSSFRDVLLDYSGAFPKADIYLVNHGPIGDAMSDLPRELYSRCHTIAELTAPHLSKREELHKAVRKYVGDPVRLPAGKRAVGQSAAEVMNTVLAVDISASMSSELGKPEVFDFVQQVAQDRCGSAALIDVTVRGVVPLEKLKDSISSLSGGSTNLCGPIKELLKSFTRVLVITDSDGLNSMKELENQKVLTQRSGLFVIEVLT